MDRPRPALIKIRILSGPQIIIAPSTRFQEPEINFVCKVLHLVDRGDEDESWDVTDLEPGPICTVVAEALSELPGVGSEVDAWVYHDFYKAHTGERQLTRLCIRRVPN
jgi:hypothetical protein